MVRPSYGDSTPSTFSAPWWVAVSRLSIRALGGSRLPTQDGDRLEVGLPAVDHQLAGVDQRLAGRTSRR